MPSVGHLLPPLGPCRVSSEQSVRASQLQNLVESLQELVSRSRDERDRGLTETRESLRSREAAAEQKERSIAVRERSLEEREQQVAALKTHLEGLLVSIDKGKADEAEQLRLERSRLSREQARIDALQAALLQEREEVRALAEHQRRLLEEAQQARQQDRALVQSQLESERASMARERAEAAASLEGWRRQETEHRRAAGELEQRLQVLRREVSELESQRDARAAAMEAEVRDLSAARAALEKERLFVDGEAARMAALAQDLEDRTQALNR